MLYIIIYFSVTICIWFMRIKFIHSFKFIHILNSYWFPADKQKPYFVERPYKDNFWSSTIFVMSENIFNTLYYVVKYHDVNYVLWWWSILDFWSTRTSTNVIQYLYGLSNEHSYLFTSMFSSCSETYI